MADIQPSMIVRALLSLLLITGYGYIVLKFMGASVSVSTDTKDVLVFLFGALTTSVVTMIQYWFGSSQGSADKTQELRK